MNSRVPGGMKWYPPSYTTRSPDQVTRTASLPSGTRFTIMTATMTAATAKMPIINNGARFILSIYYDPHRPSRRHAERPWFRPAPAPLIWKQ
jgi:hypothetical protein